MVDVKIEGDKVVFEVEGWHKLWALRSRLEIPLSHIKDVYADPDPAMGWFQGLKMIGTDVPSVFRAGTFYQQGDRIFWDVRHPEQAIVIELQEEWYGKLIVEVADPAGMIELLKRAAHP